MIVMGGISPEHEVSIITGLQALEHIDRNIYRPYLIYVTELGEIQLLQGANLKTDFDTNNAMRIFFSYNQNERQPFLYIPDLQTTVPLYAAINAMHGGLGEGGAMAGFLSTHNIPQTSETVESAVISMNKYIAKNIVASEGIDVVPSVCVNRYTSAKPISLSFPLIVKPVHFGSSIAISIVHNEEQLQQAINTGLLYDEELLIEKLITNPSEYNCSVRMVGESLEISNYEHPLSENSILKFSDKYRGGAKKLSGGMVNLRRELPATLTSSQVKNLNQMATQVYRSCRCSGTVRIDWIADEKNVFYFNEINPIPGSFANYLWEVEGQSFTSQLSAMIEQAVSQYNQRPLVPFERSSIVKDFINSKDR